MHAYHDHAPDDASGARGSDAPQTDEGQGTNWLEWMVLALGVAITFCVIGYLGYQVAFGSDEPVDLQVVLQAPETNGATVFIPLEVKNMGDAVAEEAIIEVCAGPDSCSEVSFTFVPKGSARTGTVGLRAPLGAPLTSRVVSYRE